MSPSPHGNPTIEPAFIEWQKIILRSLPHLKFLGQKAKSNHWGNSNEPPIKKDYMKSCFTLFCRLAIWKNMKKGKTCSWCPDSWEKISYRFHNQRVLFTKMLLRSIAPIRSFEKEISDYKLKRTAKKFYTHKYWFSRYVYLCMFVCYPQLKTYWCLTWQQTGQKQRNLREKVIYIHWATQPVSLPSSHLLQFLLILFMN